MFKVKNYSAKWTHLFGIKIIWIYNKFLQNRIYKKAHHLWEPTFSSDKWIWHTRFSHVTQGLCADLVINHTKFCGFYMVINWHCNTSCTFLVSFIFTHCLLILPLYRVFKYILSVLRWKWWLALSHLNRLETVTHNIQPALKISSLQNSTRFQNRSSLHKFVLNASKCW